MTSNPIFPIREALKMFLPHSHRIYYEALKGAKKPVLWKKPPYKLNPGKMVK